MEKNPYAKMSPIIRESSTEQGPAYRLSRPLLKDGIFVDHMNSNLGKGAEKEQKGAGFNFPRSRPCKEPKRNLEREGSHTRSTASLRTASRLPSLSAMEAGFPPHGSPSLLSCSCCSPSRFICSKQESAACWVMRLFTS